MSSHENFLFRISTIDYQDFSCVLRITKKKSGRLLPIEKGLKKDGSSYRIEDQCATIAELNNFAVSDKRSLYTVWKLLLSIINKENIDKLYCLVDPENRFTNSFYSDLGFKNSEQYNELIIFPTYGKVINNVFIPSKWKILVIEDTQKMAKVLPVNQLPVNQLNKI